MNRNRMRLISAVLIVWMLAALAGCSVPPGTSATPSSETASETAASESATASPSVEVSATSSEILVAPTATGAPTTSASAAAPAPLTVTEGTLAYSNEYVDIDVRYPVISGMADAAVQSGINDGVLVYMKDMASEMESQSEEDAGSFPHGLYTLEADFEVKRNDGVVLSIRIDITTYNGGANVGLDSAFVNVVNSDPAQQLTLEGLFVSGADYATVLNAKISALIAADPDADAFSFTGVSPSEWYYLTDTNLVIVFPTYSIAPGADGEPEFVIPLADLADILISGVL